MSSKELSEHLVEPDLNAHTGLWTNDAAFEIRPDGQVLPGTEETHHKIRQEFIKRSFEQKRDQILLDGRRVITGGYAPEFLAWCWHATPADLAWDRAKHSKQDPYTEMRIPKHG